MGSRLNALNYVEDVFNNKVHPELQWMTVRNGDLERIIPSYPILNPNTDQPETLDEYQNRLVEYIQTHNLLRGSESLPSGPEQSKNITQLEEIVKRLSIFQRDFLAIQGNPVNDEGVGIVEERREDIEDYKRDYWVGIRASNRDTLTSFRGVRIRTTAITIVMGVGVSLWEYEETPEQIPVDRLGLPRGEGNKYLAEKTQIERRVAFNVLEFMERRSMVYFQRARRLRNQISMSDEYRLPVAYRRFTVIINA